MNKQYEDTLNILFFSKPHGTKTVQKGSADSYRYLFRPRKKISNVGATLSDTCQKNRIALQSTIHKRAKVHLV